MILAKSLLRRLLSALYRVDMKGLEHYERAGERVLIVANHTSFLDALLLAAFLPERVTFAVNTHIAKAWWVRPALALVEFFPMDPANPLSTKSLIKHVRENRKAVIFPEGRITVTGSLMKIYQGPGLVADKSNATLLPVRIEGAQYTPFSRLRGRVRTRWFPKISITVLPPRRIQLPEELRGRARRNRAGKVLADVMTEMMFATSNYQRTLFQALLDAMRTHGGSHQIAEDISRKPVTYRSFLIRAFALGEKLAEHTKPGEYAGVLLPGMVNTVVTFFALHAYGRVPAMLNFSVGAQAVCSTVETAGMCVVFTSRQFVLAAKLQSLIELLEQRVRVVYLEDVAASMGIGSKVRAMMAAQVPQFAYRRNGGFRTADDPAVVLFTSGSEGVPKGVVLSHANLLANREQLAARVDFSSQDVILNALPLFHSFGLTAGTLLPLLSGMRVFFYPSPLHYRIIPEVAYDINATILFGTNTFLSGYARFAHPYDFYSVRYVFAGAERLQDQTRRVWAEKFGLRILEGYGATETSPVITANTAMDYRPGTVGRLLPGVEYYLDPVPGISEGGRLVVRGPNIMIGYLLSGRGGEIVSPRTERGDSWYDTGDIVSIDGEGFVTIQGRAKRFAKVGGEMVSLAAVEQLAAEVWPDRNHAVIAQPDPQKGEQLVLVTDAPGATRKDLATAARAAGLGEINVPRRVVSVAKVPLLGTGKIDYKGAEHLAVHSGGMQEGSS